MAKFSNRCCPHYGFGSCHAVLALSTAFRVTSILRIRAASARFGWLSFGGELAVAGLQRALVGLEAGEDGHAEGVAGLTAAALENAAVLAQAAVLGEGARPARAATLRRSSVPSSGSSPIRMAVRIGPQPSRL